MQRTRWWTAAIWGGVEAAIAIWLCSSAVVILGALLIDWGPVAFLQRVGLPVFLIVLACTVPLWIIGGLLWLVGAFRNPGQQARPSQTVGNAATGRDRRASADAGERGRSFRSRWSHRWNSIERGVLDWFVLRPALREQHVEAGDQGNRYLRRYLNGWLVGSISISVTLTVTALGARARVVPGDTSLEGVFIAVTLVEFALAAGLCGVLLARYVVTRAMMRRLVATAHDGNRHVRETDV